MELHDKRIWFKFSEYNTNDYNLLLNPIKVYLIKGIEKLTP